MKRIGNILLIAILMPIVGLFYDPTALLLMFNSGGAAVDGVARAAAAAAQVTANLAWWKVDNFKIKNVLDYGADSTGATLSDVAIQRACADARAVQGTVLFPTGKYSYRTTIPVDTSGMKILGAGVRSTMLYYHGDGTHDGILLAKRVATAGVHVYGVEVAGFTLVCDTALNGIEVNRVGKFSIHDIRIGGADDNQYSEGSASYYTAALSVKFGMIVDIRNINISGNQANNYCQYGIVLDTLTSNAYYTTASQIVNPHIDYTGIAGIVCNRSTQGITISGGSVEGNHGKGLWCRYSSSWIHVDGTWFEVNPGGDIVVDRSDDCVFENIIASDGKIDVGASLDAYRTTIRNCIVDTLLLGANHFQTKLENVTYTHLYSNAAPGRTTRFNVTSSLIVTEVPSLALGAEPDSALTVANGIHSTRGLKVDGIANIATGGGAAFTSLDSTAITVAVLDSTWLATYKLDSTKTIMSVASMPWTFTVDSVLVTLFGTASTDTVMVDVRFARGTAFPASATGTPLINSPANVPAGATTTTGTLNNPVVTKNMSLYLHLKRIVGTPKLATVTLLGRHTR